MSRKYGLTDTFGFAFEGLKTAFRREPNFRMHVISSIGAIILGFVFSLQPLEWLLLSTTIVIVFVLELINTALEALVNILSPEKHPEAKVAKDVAAASVLFAALLSIVVGVVLFGPKLLLLF